MTTDALEQIGRAGETAGVGVVVSSAMVTRFAALTGDRSSLHVDDAFARRSQYRRTVAHGMLPVAFLALLPPLRAQGFRCRLMGLTGRFSAPVFPGDSLELGTSTGRPSGPSQLEFDYRIARRPSGSVVTSGTVSVAYQPAPEARWNTTSAVGAATLLTGPVSLNSFRIEQIQTGAGDQLTFTVTPAALQEFATLLQEGSGGAAVSPDWRVLADLLSLMLFSTSIGVSLPGSSATFLEFAAHLKEPLEIDAPYVLRGRVAHRSLATRIVKKELLITPAGRDDVVVNGKASAIVASPARAMPTTDELKASGIDFGLRHKVVLVTGASRGIGETTAKLFALHGAKVIVNYHRGAEDAQRVVDEITAAGGDAFAIGADVSNATEVSRLVQHARDRYGTIHVLVNNAARDYRPVPFLQLEWDDLQRDLDVIAKGAFLCCRQVIPLMLEQGEGKIVNVGTVATEDPPADQTKYVVAKSALVGLTRSLSIEFASRNIQVNLVVPNFVETDFVAHVQDGFRKKIAQEIPMRRPASPLDVARAVVFLASSYSSFTTGQQVMVTGGGAPYA